MGKPLCLRIQQAVCGSTLDSDTRHLLMVMALLADGTTGAGFAGQETIAAAVGCSSRHVRKLLATLAERKDSPIMVTRQRRGAARGRTSDQYQLTFAQAEQRSGSATPPQEEHRSGSVREPKRNSVPVGTTFKLVPQPEQHDSPTGTAGQPKRNVASEDQRSDQRSDQRRPSAPRQKAGSEKPPVAGSHELKIHYVEEFTKTRGEPPEFGKAWARAVRCFGALVTAHGLEKSKSIVTAAMAAGYGSVTPWAIEQNAVNHLGKKPQPNRGRAPVPQRGVADEAEAQNWGRANAQALIGGAE